MNQDKPPIAASLWAAVSAFLFTFLALAVVLTILSGFFPIVLGRNSLASWFVFVASFVHALRRGLTHRSLAIHRYRVVHRLCPHCGYDVRASNRKCSECGRDLSPFQSNHPI